MLSLRPPRGVAGITKARNRTRVLRDHHTMSRSNEPDAQRAVEPALEPGEQLLTMLSATVSNWGDGGGYYIVRPVVTLLRVLNRRRWARAAGRSQGLRLRPAFIVAVTSQRV